MKTRMLTVIMLILLAVPAIAENALLPLFTQGVIHIWNPHGTTNIVTVNGKDLTVPLFTDLRIPWTGQPTSWNIQLNDMRAWLDVNGVVFEAQVPKLRWEMPVSQGTGILLASGKSTTLRLTINDPVAGRYETQNALIVANTSLAFFVSQYFGHEVTGTLVIDADDPIYVNASQCGVVCHALPVNTN